MNLKVHDPYFLYTFDIYIMILRIDRFCSNVREIEIAPDPNSATFLEIVKLLIKVLIALVAHFFFLFIFV